MKFSAFDIQRDKTIGVTVNGKKVGLEFATENLSNFLINHPNHFLFIERTSLDQYEYTLDTPKVVAERCIREVNSFDEAEDDFNRSHSLFQIYLDNDRIHIFWNHMVCDGMALFDLLPHLVGIKSVVVSPINIYDYRWKTITGICQLLKMLPQYRAENVKFSYRNLHVRNDISKETLIHDMEKFSIDMNTACIIRTARWVLEKTGKDQINMMVNVAIVKNPENFNNFSTIPLIVTRDDSEHDIINNLKYNVRYTYFLYKMMCRTKVHKKKSSFFIDVVYSSAPENRHSHSFINFVQVHQKDVSYPFLITNRFAKKDAQQSILVNTDCFSL